jgi:hypothetical protein
MKEIITLSRREGGLTLKAGTGLMGVCYRQAKRLLARYQREGLRGLAHRLSGKG